MIRFLPPQELHFQAEVAPHSERLLYVARRILGSDDLAWDAVQETLLALWTLGRTPPNPRAWLLRAVVHRSLHLRRSLQRRRQNEDRAPDTCPWCGLEDPQRYLENQDLRDTLAEALAGLSPEQRTTFLLYEVQGQDYASIATRLRVPVGTVRSRLNRARATLRGTLERRGIQNLLPVPVA